MVDGGVAWADGDHGWLVSEQDGVTLFVAQESSGWVFWAARRRGRRQETLSLSTGLAGLAEAKSLAVEWLSGYRVTARR